MTERWTVRRLLHYPPPCYWEPTLGVERKQIKRSHLMEVGMRRHWYKIHKNFSVLLKPLTYAVY
jgi:hypothetical protein